MGKTILKLNIVIFGFLTFMSCKNDKMTKDCNTNSLIDGIFEINETDSGKIQTDKKNPVLQRMQQLKIPGLSIAVIDNYKIQESLTYGKRDSFNNVENNTVFEAASVSKYVTAIIVHYYIEKGLLDLDTDINQYLKSWKMPINDFTKDNPITLRHLLTHQSGLPSTNFDYDKEKGIPTLSQVLGAESPAINKPAIPEFAPGSAWSYSNIGYALIQMILEDVTNKSFQNIAEEIIFKPLKMNSSTFDYPLPKNLRDKEAKPFNSAKQEKPSELDSPAKAQGGLMCTPDDLARLTIEIMKAYKGKSNIFSKELIDNLITKELELPFKFYNQTAYMGLGVLLIGNNENLAFIHNGYNSPGSVCIVIGFPEIGKGAVIASNSANGERLYLEVITTLSDNYKWPSGQFFKTKIE
jgi:CubicO group peptidase (beta-lactamase class C family)